MTRPGKLRGVQESPLYREERFLKSEFEVQHASKSISAKPQRTEVVDHSLESSLSPRHARAYCAWLRCCCREQRPVRITQLMLHHVDCAIAYSRDTLKRHSLIELWCARPACFLSVLCMRETASLYPLSWLTLFNGLRSHMRRERLREIFCKSPSLTLTNTSYKPFSFHPLNSRLFNAVVVAGW